MAEVTDSFCERCGTKYVFAPSGPKSFSLKGARVLAKGLRNFVLTDGQSIADAMQLARQEDGHQATTHVAEAFYKTFNFCMSCRQYACDRCWNAAAGACLSCSPVLEPEVELAARPTVFAEGAPEAAADSAEAAWPAVDLPDHEPAQYAASASDGTSSDDDATPIPWPITDQIAPEMTLTAHELELVQAQLGQVQPPADVPTFAADKPAASPPAAEAAPMVPLLDQKPTWWNARIAEADEEPATADWALPGLTEESPAPEIAAAAIQAVNPAIPPEPVEAFTLAQAAEEQVVVERDIPAAAVRMLHRTASAPTLPPLTSITSTAAEEEPAGLVARLFGRRGQEAATSTGASPRRVAVRKGQPVGDPWPTPTSWMQRSFDGSHWWRGLYAADDEPAAAPDAEFVLDQADRQSAAAQELEFETVVEPAPAVPDSDLRPAEFAATPAAFGPPAQSSVQPAEPAASAPALEPAPASPPATVESSTADIDPRSAAALRLSAVEGAADAEDALPSMWQSQFEASTVEARLPPVPREPAWLRVQREAADMPAREVEPPARIQESAPAAASTRATPSEPNEPQAAAEAPQPAPTASWPPLGASWPSRESPGAPWPGPEPASVPALLAARQFPEQALTELWVQSSQEVMNRGSVRVCRSCALPVSTQARFCRRCGSQQA